jgi:hypothetical protein
VFLHLTGHKTEDADPASSDAPAKRRDRKARA